MDTFTRRSFLRASLGGAAAAAPASAFAAIAELARKEKLNVLFIMSDQHNARALGCYGNEEIKTPNLDRLAREGVRFDRAYCQTGQCCPSRYTIWTGRYAKSHGCRWNGVEEPLKETTIGEVFKQAGYVTGTIGKHHMRHSPVKHGFDTVIDRREFHKFLAAENVKPPEAEGDWLGVEMHGPLGATARDNEHHYPGFWASETIRFLREHKDEPFCLWQSFYGPHTPIIASHSWATMYEPSSLTLPGNFRYQPNEEHPWQLARARANYAPFTEEQHRQVLALYYGLVSQIDHNIGRVLDELDALGLADKTIVVYTADHGEMMCEHGVWEKYVLGCEATIRVPLLIRLPGVLPAGKVVRKLAGSVDLMPTLCELTGLPAPGGVQGRSLVPLMTGEPEKWRDFIVSEIGYPGIHAGRCVTVRTAEVKYVHHDNHGNPCEELFDMAVDPWETRNLVNDPAYAKRADAMRTALVKWESSTEDAPMYPIIPVDAPAARVRGSKSGNS